MPLEIVENSKEADPIVLRALQRNYKPFPPRPIKELKVYYGVWLGDIPFVYTTPGKTPSRTLS